MRNRPSNLGRTSIALLALAMVASACGRDELTADQPTSPTDLDTSVTATTAGAPPAEPHERDPLLLLSGRQEVVALDTSDGTVSYRGHNGVAAPDRSAIAQVIGRQVSVVDPATGVARWSHPVAEARRVRVVAPGGRMVALVDSMLPTPSSARARTTITIADSAGARDLVLEGNLDPEAFTRDGTTMVAVEYLPAMNPDHYSVRLVDLATGEVRPVPDQPGHFPDNSPRPRMRGYARTQVSSPDGRFLYTYYSSSEPINEDHEHYFAFVHVLDLELGEAYCIDLAPPFGTGPGDTSAPALTLTPDSRRLLVTDRVTGALAAIDTTTLDVLATSALVPALAPEWLPVATASGDSLYLGLGRELLRINPSTLRTIDTIETEAPITGLKMDRTGEVLYAVTTANISLLDPQGSAIDAWALPLEGGGADPAVAIPGSGAYQCAC
jgi:hypothetical protein